MTFDWLGSIRHGFRLLAKAPGASAVAVFVLALGIGANATIFSAVNTVLLRLVPVPAADRLVSLVHWNAQRNMTGESTPYADAAEWRRTLTGLDAISGYQRTTVNLSREEDPERVVAARVNAGFFAMLGVRPAWGRDFAPEEDRPGAARASIITHGLWTRRFGASLRALDSLIQLDGEPCRVVGVLPPGFRFIGERADIYLPLALPETRERPNAVTVYARLKPGMKMDQIQPELEALSAATAVRQPGYKGWQLRARSLSEWILPDVKLSLWLLLGAMGLLLLMACANVANLLLCRALARRREFALRTALGASRGRLVREMILESLPLGIIGSVLGLALTFWAVSLVARTSIERFPRIDEIRVDGAALWFLAGVSGAACLLFSAAPAWALPRIALSEALKDGLASSGAGMRGQNFRSVLVVAQVALGLMLATGAVLMVRTFSALSSVRPGFDSTGLFTARFDLPRTRFRSSEQVLELYQRLRERVASIPGVESVTLTNSLPLGSNYFRASFAAKGSGEALRQEDFIPLGFRSVDSGYLQTLRIPLNSGRPFTSADRKGAPPVMLLNESAARRLFGHTNVTGREVMFEGAFTVVGVIPDVFNEDVARTPAAEVLLPLDQMPVLSVAVAVRLNPQAWPDPARFAPYFGPAVHALDPNLAIYRAVSMESMMADRLAPRRISMVMLLWCSAAALALAALGVYGVLSHAVELRFREIGIRMALGAAPAGVVGMVVRRTLRLVAAGLAVGGVAAFAATRSLKGLLYGVTGDEPAVYATAALVLASAAAAAAWIPARRAASVDPLIALRHE